MASVSCPSYTACILQAHTSRSLVSFPWPTKHGQALQVRPLSREPLSLGRPTTTRPLASSSLTLLLSPSSFPNMFSHPRIPSAPLFSLFSPSQIKQFQEAFNLLDVDRDGFITPTDLSSSLTNLGLPTAALESYFSSEQQGKINFTAFLSMMGEHLLKFDTQEELGEAFASFDEGDEGVVRVEDLREWLGTTGDRMSVDEVSLGWADWLAGLFGWGAS